MGLQKSYQSSTLSKSAVSIRSYAKLGEDMDSNNETLQFCLILYICSVIIITRQYVSQRAWNESWTEAISWSSWETRPPLIHIRTVSAGADIFKDLYHFRHQGTLQKILTFFSRAPMFAPKCTLSWKTIQRRMKLWRETVNLTNEAMVWALIARCFMKLAYMW